MGEVYQATDLRLEQPVALKFLPEARGVDPAALRRLSSEVRIARQVTHPNVCRVYDIGEAEGFHYISMEYIDGEDLSSLLRRIGHVPADKALQITRCLCVGLAAAHEKGIIHRDLKPGNVMIDGSGQARITDFGLAGLAKQFMRGKIQSGTPLYMAPEQIAGGEVSVRSDIYSLGLVLYELFHREAHAREKIPGRAATGSENFTRAAIELCD
jgi:serine/threonine-protein kinase